MLAMKLLAGGESDGVPPDLGTCLLQQKLAMVQLCITRRRRARKQQASVGVTSAELPLCQMRA